MSKKLFILGLASLAFFFLIPKDAFAKRLLPRARPTSTASTGGSVSRTRGLTTSVKFRGDRRAIIVTISNLSISSSVSYNLSYKSRGLTQGAGGTIRQGAAEPVVRELLFGTCSAGVCRYDTGITNARFTVTTVLKNGLKIIKPYRLKV